MAALSRLPNEILEDIVVRAVITREELVALSTCPGNLGLVATRLLYRRLVIAKSGAKGPLELRSVLRNIINDRNLASGVQELVICEVHKETPDLVGASLTSDPYTSDSLDEKDSRLFVKAAQNFLSIDDEDQTRVGWTTQLRHGHHDALVALLLCHVLPRLICLELDLGAMSWMSRSIIRVAAGLQNVNGLRFTRLKRVIVRGPIGLNEICETALLSVSSLESIRVVNSAPFCSFFFYTGSGVYITALELHGCSLTSQDLENILRRQPNLCHLSLRLTSIMPVYEGWGLDNVVLALEPIRPCLRYLELSGPGFDNFNWEDLPSGLIHFTKLKTVAFDSSVFYIPEFSIVDFLLPSLETLEFIVSNQQDIMDHVTLARMFYCLEGIDELVPVQRLQRIQVKIPRPTIETIGTRVHECPEADDVTTVLIDRVESIFAQLGPKCSVCWINDWIDDEDDALYQDGAETRDAVNQIADECGSNHESGTR